MQQVTGEDRPDVDPELLGVVNDFGQIEAMPADRRKKLRYVLLSHDNDGVTKFGADLIASKPQWFEDGHRSMEEVPRKPARPASRDAMAPAYHLHPVARRHERR